MALSQLGYYITLSIFGQNTLDKRPFKIGFMNTMALTIYHNPRCSKSRQTLALIEASGVQVVVILYLETPPTCAELAKLLKKLGMAPRDLLRRGEADYKALKLSDMTLDDSSIIQAMSEYPKLIERPIVVSGSRAVIGRPPENVNVLL